MSALVLTAATLRLQARSSSKYVASSDQKISSDRSERPEQTSCAAQDGFAYVSCALASCFCAVVSLHRFAARAFAAARITPWTDEKADSSLAPRHGRQEEP